MLRRTDLSLSDLAVNFLAALYLDRKFRMYPVLRGTSRAVEFYPFDGQLTVHLAGV